jgi:hypothetical protein
MKTNDPKSIRKQGSVLVITMSVIAVAVLVLASYLMIVQSQVAAVTRSQTWNSAISLAEAGMEEGMATVNYGQPSIIANPYAWTNVLSTANWTITSTNASMTRVVSSSAIGSNSYTTTITWSGTNAPTVTSVGIVNYSSIPWVFSAARGHSFLAQVGSQGTTASATTTMGRKIQVATVLSPVFSAGVVSKTNFDMSGNNCTIDSFNSSSTSTNNVGGQYTTAVRAANGNVATDSAVVDSLDIGQGNVYGSVYTGPGTAQTCVEIGHNGTVGNLAWVNGGNSGIQPGHWFGNFNMNIPDVTSPNTTGWSTSLPAASNGVITLNGGSYVVASLSTPLLVKAPTVLWVQNSLSLGVTMTNTGSLILYVGTTSGSGMSLSWSGQGTCNVPGYASNLQIYGLPSLTSIDLHGNSAWIGCLYAPEAAFTGGGGGNNTQDTSGAIICNSVSLKGHWNFHYDESLAVTGPSRGYIATGWKEVSYP